MTINYIFRKVAGKSDVVSGHTVELTTTVDHLMSITPFKQCVIVMDIGKPFFNYLN